MIILKQDNMKTKFFLLLFAYMASSMMFATDVYDFTTMNLSQSDLAITNGSVSYNSSKGYYEVSNNADETLSMTINGVPNVEFKYWAETSKKAFKVKPNEYIQLDGATRTLRITNLNINDIVTLRVASKGPSEANSFSGGLTNCTLYSGNLTQAEYDYPFVYEDVSFKAAASTIEITNTAGGYCLTTISIERSQSSDTQHSGTCGPNLTWTLIEDVLIISGSGNMYDFTWDDSPWYSYRQSITSVAIGNSVTSIGNYAFYQCSGLTSVTIPNSVTSIGERAFQSCSGLTSITIPNSVTSIGDLVFLGCSRLMSVTIPNSVTSIGLGAFFDCSGLTSITIPNSVTSIGENAFYGCSGLTSVTIPNSATSIGFGAFSGCSGLTSVTIPNSVTSIGGYAFWGCSGLTSVTIPNSVTSIGDYAFQNCSGLTSVSIPNSVTSIGDYAFQNCSGLTSITIPNSVTSIGNEAFSGCLGLIRVEAPAEFFDFQSVTKSLQKVTVNAGELNENELLFIARSYKTLKTIDVSAVSNIYLADEAFNGFYNLDTLILPSSLERMGYMMAAGCKNLKCITIPAPVTEIEPSAFENCRSMTEVTFAGNNVTRIDDWAFYNCHQLQNIVIPEGVSEIGLAVFYGCTYLNEVSLPASVQQIGDHAFANCTHMGKMHVDAVTPPTIDSKTFDEVSRTMPVYVPDGSVNSYQADVLWGQLNIVGASQEGTSLNNINGSNVSVRKILDNGQLYILLPDGTRYDATGKKVE